MGVSFLAAAFFGAFLPALALALVLALGFALALAFRFGWLGGGRLPGFRLGQRPLALQHGRHCRRLYLSLSPGSLQAEKK